jgi:hypothetical protein
VNITLKDIWIMLVVGNIQLIIITSLLGLNL